MFWSGGKDSCLACYEAISHSLTISYLLNFTIRDKPYFHGSPELIHAQLQSINIPFIQKNTTWRTYKEDFECVINELKKVNICGAVFGDIHLQEHRDWLEKVCNKLNIKPYFPLWHRDPIQILNTFLSKGFEAIVMSVRADLFDKEWLGKRINKKFIKDLSKRKGEIDVCGEFGEYHTFVTNGPIFKKRLIVNGYKVLKDGYWFLNVSRFTIKNSNFKIS
ncbi:MAG: diphthine--ammonia ligase [Nitrososphaerales archaeon]